MNELPLHPALVHLPIALVFFAPLFGVYVAREITRVGRLFPEPAGQPGPNSRPPAPNGYARKRWRWVVVWAFAQTILIYGTMVSGERDADVVKAYLAESPSRGPGHGERPDAGANEFLAAIDAHENAAGLLLLLSGAALFAALIALKPSPTASRWRLATIGVQLLALGACLYTARLGGELVYRHGAAEAHRARGADLEGPLLRSDRLRE
ncbi:MAG: DUF2231 domain-containing protein [Leptospirales bacterium]|jgi:uncharacterized membrane protein